MIDCICPCCRGKLREAGVALVCSNAYCARAFPVVDGVPILINEERSVFRIADFVGGSATTIDWQWCAARAIPRGPLHALRRAVVDLSPSLTLSINTFTAHHALKAILSSRPAARILVIGCGDEQFPEEESETFLYSDVSIGPITQIVFDATDIPFPDETFDAVVTVAVIPYVSDPFRCVAEIRRVLNSGGFVYDTSAFMQQIALGRYDFTRFTYAGHRRLFRGFDVLQRGMTGGPAMALCWSISYFIESFFENLTLRKLARLGCRYCLFWLKYCDLLLVNRKGSYDAASGFFFFGRKRDQLLTDREILDSHVGLRPQ